MTDDKDEPQDVETLWDEAALARIFPDRPPLARALSAPWSAALLATQIDRAKRARRGWELALTAAQDSLGEPDISEADRVIAGFSVEGWRGALEVVDEAVRRLEETASTLALLEQRLSRRVRPLVGLIESKRSRDHDLGRAA